MHSCYKAYLINKALAYRSWRVTRPESLYINCLVPMNGMLNLSMHLHGLHFSVIRQIISCHFNLNMNFKGLKL